MKDVSTAATLSNNDTELQDDHIYAETWQQNYRSSVLKMTERLGFRPEHLRM